MPQVFTPYGGGLVQSLAFQLYEFAGLIQGICFDGNGSDYNYYCPFDNITEHLFAIATKSLFDVICNLIFLHSTPLSIFDRPFTASVMFVMFRIIQHPMMLPANQLAGASHNK